jgi:hypothetical protein
MESPEDIEKALAALVPSAISERGQRSLEELIDSLAAGEAPVAELPESAPAPVVVPQRRPWAWLGAAGAAAAAVVMAFQMSGSGTRPQAGGSPVAAAAAPEVISLGKSEFVDSAEPGDWVSEKDGVLHRVVRIRYVNQERLRDVKTGVEMVVTEASEDLGWSPIASF